MSLSVITINPGGAVGEEKQNYPKTQRTNTKIREPNVVNTYQNQLPHQVWKEQEGKSYILKASTTAGRTWTNCPKTSVPMWPHLDKMLTTMGTSAS